MKAKNWVSRFLLLGVILGVLTNAVADQGTEGTNTPAPKNVRGATAAEQEDGLFWEIEQLVPDMNLRRSMSRLLQVTEAYEVPREGDGNVDMMLDLCREGRCVFALCERHQLLWGIESFQNLVPVLEKLMKHALDKLKWVKERGTHDTDILLAYRITERRFLQATSYKPIERAGVLEMAATLQQAH
ncbi:MAG: hypothetical protein A3J59_04880 [Candidatus Buchananbacteria bacterium RIFCSPHIGHO2_02_FULL_56_16]|uniref:Uncharacterized protein n=1 Tax=Candidatus Buchananbacteria bacterium RIFCSPHIGHO2_02_FULL_56_16 TaxID=1797542 RepID=A0A1G1YH80_9BACT|nr:MAG: hypothetical protein A3J59_04880 [Candidatus Buchananbacteria bacterium RIFCSPHIGHO2_02_FULL_56_16]